MADLSTMIVDILRNKLTNIDNNALNQGGLVAGTPEADALLAQQKNAGVKHGGKSYMDIVTEAERGPQR